MSDFKGDIADTYIEILIRYLNRLFKDVFINKTKYFPQPIRRNVDLKIRERVEGRELKIHL